MPAVAYGVLRARTSPRTRRRAGSSPRRRRSRPTARGHVVVVAERAREAAPDRGRVVAVGRAGLVGREVAARARPTSARARRTCPCRCEEADVARRSPGGSARPEYRGATPLIPSQQSSLSGTRTAFACQRAIARTEAAVAGPSKMPWPWTQAYSVPERLTPWKTTTRPRASSRRLPSTWRPLAGWAGRARRAAWLGVVLAGAPPPGAAALAQPARAATHAAAVPAAARRRAGRRLRLAAGTLRAHPRVGAEGQRPGGAQDLRGDERRGARHRAVRRAGAPAARRPART